MYLLIDDTRDLNCQLIARNAKIGKKVLDYFHGQIECLCIDHDLGIGESGYDVLKWAIQNNYVPKKVQLVSSNPPGRENMAKLLLASGFESKDNFNFNSKTCNK